ncbi:MAG: NAD/NADP octopine/nopaline dehydrogenase family protein [Betaproteobacteria bacterium]|nr:NAD/NADP octopine/nopaline dehydrogenase family protein [Betaproteobacteria bacterium]
MTIKTVAIVGAGPGGFRLVANLGLAGYRLRLNDIDDAKLTAIRARGGIDVEGTPGGFAPLELATTDLGATIAGADLIIVVSGGNTQPGVARALAPLLVDGQTILLMQGNTGGSLIVRRELDRAGCRADIELAETDTYPYAMRALGPTKMRQTTQKRWMQIAAFPGNRSVAAHKRIGPLFPQSIAAPDILHTGLMNVNAILHVANCLASAARIERGGGHLFYGEGVTAAVANLYTAIDAERMAIAAALEVKVPSLADWIERAYNVHETDLVKTFQRLSAEPDGPYVVNKAVGTLNHKYVTEDVPTGLMPMQELGTATATPTLAIDTLVEMAKLMTGRTFTDEARTLERMGLAGMGAKEIRGVVRDGFG